MPSWRCAHPYRTTSVQVAGWFETGPTAPLPPESPSPSQAVVRIAGARTSADDTECLDSAAFYSSPL